MVDVIDTGPLDWRIAITDGNGRPTNEFMRRWNTQRVNNGLITPVTIASGIPGAPVPSDGAEYIDISTSPPTLYVSSGGTWIVVGVYNFLDLNDVPHSYTAQADKLVQVNGSADGLEFNSLSQVLDALGANQGDILFRGAAGWETLAPGTSGDALITGGASSDPTWGPAGSSLEIQSNGTTLTSAATLINFTTNMTATVSGTQVTVSSSGSGGGGSYEATPTAPPPPSSFTLLNGGGTTTLSTASDGLNVLDTSSASANIRFAMLNAGPPAPPYTIIVRRTVEPPTLTSGYPGAIILRNSTTGGIIVLGTYQQGGLVQYWSSYTAFSSNILSPVQWYGGLAVRWWAIGNDGTNLTFWASEDGITWSKLSTTTIASSILAVDQIGIGGMTNGGPIGSTFQSFQVASGSVPSGSGGGGGGGGGTGTVTQLNAGAGITLSPNPITTTGTVSLTYPYASIINVTANVALSGERAVIINSSGLADYPSISALSDGLAVVGITTGAISAAAVGQVQTEGVMDFSGWSWTPGVPVYVDNLGVLTQSVPVGSWLLQIGIATLPTEIIISPRAIIALA